MRHLSLSEVALSPIGGSPPAAEDKYRHGRVRERRLRPGLSDRHRSAGGVLGPAGEPALGARAAYLRVRAASRSRSRVP
jgi:hypothetical protein